MVTGFMHVMSYIGSAGFYVPVLVVVFWCVSPRAGAWAAVVLSLSGALNTMLKLLIHAPRPFWTDPSVTGREPLTSFGMPSGHAQGSAVAYGWAGARADGRARVRPGSPVGTRARRAAVWTVVVVVVALVGVSRVYLGVHSPGQVLAGWLIGAALLIGAGLLAPVVVPWWARRPLWAQAGLSLAVAGAFLAPMAVAVSDLHGWHMPAAWAHAVEAVGGTVRPVTLTEGATTAGLLFGVLAGVSLLAHRGWFAAAGTFWRRAARVPVGMAGAGVILGAGWAAGQAAVTVFVVHGALGVWMAAGAPEAFVRLGLADRPDPVARAAEPAQHRHS